MQITNNTARLFRHWMEVIGLAHIWDDPRWKDAPSAIPDLEAKVELAYLILDRMATRTFDEWLDIFLREGLTGDRFLTTQQALDHPQVIHNGSVVGSRRPRGRADPAARAHDQVHRQPGGRPDGRSAARRGPGRVARPATGGPCAVGAGRRIGRAAGSGAAGSGPLAGMLVLDFATWLAGPFGTSLLADMGARVIKIESPAGDDARHVPRRPGPHLPGQGEPGHRPEERGRPRGRAAAGRPGRRGHAQHARRRRGPSGHRLRDRQGTEPRHRVPVRRLVRVDRAGRRPRRVPPDDGRAQRRRAAAAGPRERAARRRRPAGRGRPVSVLPADDPLERGLARHHRRPRRRDRAEPGPAAPPAHRPRPVHRDHHAGQQPAAVLRRRHPLRGQARPARTRRRPAGAPARSTGCTGRPPDGCSCAPRPSRNGGSCARP